MIDFGRVAKQLTEQGYRAENVKEMETPKGVAASWDVYFNNIIIARCHDAGDGGCLSVFWQDPSHKTVFRGAGEVIDRIEPVDTALLSLSLLPGLVEHI
ncbi:MAG: hypothetical protein ACR2PX_08910 [Endozoicomonas sp.]|uniref:hypothetical protein n=1 Tax=Endozoicomonas sp. TaxID=1892382 RepID=UPI003D9B837C